jgi:competence protein ComEA
MGFIAGVFAYHFVVPQIPNLKQRLNSESVYIVEKECEQVVPEETADVEDITDCPIKVDVSGAVKEPGVYCFQEGETVIDAVKKAGGFADEVGLQFVARKINLASTLYNTQKIYFPYTEELSCSLQSFLPETNEVEVINKDIVNQNTSQEPTDTQNNSTDDNTNSCININNSTLEELITLNGVGESTAQKIIDARPFQTINDLLNVSGIGETTFNKFKDNICL